MFLFNRRSVTAVTIALLAASCQPVPRPFKADSNASGNPLLALPGIAGVHVLNVDGAPKAVSGKLAQAMAASLQGHDIPASTTSANGRSLFLLGVATTRRPTSRRIEVDLDWKLIGGSGESVGHYAQHAVLTADAWRSAEAKPLAALVAASAPKIAALMKGPSTVAPKVEQAAARVHVAIVTGAPGDGNRALRQAIATALRRAGLNLVDKPPRDGYVVVGGVNVGRAARGRQRIEISWSVRDPDGAELGDIKQRNTIRAGSLDGRWGDLAHVVARGAADGVTDLLRKLARKEVKRRAATRR